MHTYIAHVLLHEIERRVRLTWACFKRFGPKLYDIKTAPTILKVRMFKAKVI